MRFVDKHWATIKDTSKDHKLVNVYIDRIETVA